LWHEESEPKLRKQREKLQKRLESVGQDSRERDVAQRGRPLKCAWGWAVGLWLRTELLTHTHTGHESPRPSKGHMLQG
jgi:hypothetical protein